VFWGRYNTRDEAQRALAGIPADLRDPSAAVKTVPKG
jgi:septal ring-binding cell division protein DamX